MDSKGLRLGITENTVFNGIKAENYKSSAIEFRRILGIKGEY